MLSMLLLTDPEFQVSCPMFQVVQKSKISNLKLETQNPKLYTVRRDTSRMTRARQLRDESIGNKSDRLLGNESRGVGFLRNWS